MTVEAARAHLSNAELGKDVLGLEPGLLGKYVLMPGDPDRIDLMLSQWDTGKPRSLVRGFRAAAGAYKGVAIAALSSGVGGPSLEGPLTRAAGYGADTFIRVGTTGALRAEIRCGDLVIDEAAVRLDGTSRMYVRDEYPAVASHEVTAALIQACEELGVGYHVGVGATAASFYAGQGRASYGGYKRSDTDALFADLQLANVLNFEMEVATLFTLARLFGVRAGAICAVVANRVTGEWEEGEGIARACRAGAEAVRILTDWDKRKAAAGKRYFYPGLIA